ncbi:solute carrier family 49 member A3 isoform X2 [Passer domesticus]|uniref:solute carrier family 49 member A3 isoform X2 n=1 Tax=Passer domesticus TaxID=48849 RepID=UPI0030FF168C
MPLGCCPEATANGDSHGNAEPSAGISDGGDGGRCCFFSDTRAGEAPPRQGNPRPHTSAAPMRSAGLSPAEERGRPAPAPREGQAPGRGGSAARARPQRSPNPSRAEPGPPRGGREGRRGGAGPDGAVPGRAAPSRAAMEGSEAASLLGESSPGPPARFKTYRRRWFLLAVVCLLNCSNAMLWLTFAPVADKTAAYFQISLETVNWLSMVYLLISIPFGLVATWVLDSVGLRCAVVLSAWLNMVGSITRMFSVLKFLSLGSQNYWYLFVGQCFSALAQPLIIFSPTKLAALWFPDHQRATANMIASMSNPLGILIANLLSPALVPEGKHIPLMLGIYAVPAVTACALATLGIHEKVPPTPPSASATNSNSQPFFTGLKMLLRNKPYIILAVCFGGGIGMFTCFSALLEQILCEKGYSNDFAGLNGALFTVCGLLGAFLLGMYVDRTRKFIESTKISFCLSALASIMFAVTSRFRHQAIMLAITSSLFGFFGFAIYPIAMELAVECSYPVGEGTSTGLIFVASSGTGAGWPLQWYGLFLRDLLPH